MKIALVIPDAVSLGTAKFQTQLDRHSCTPTTVTNQILLMQKLRNMDIHRSYQDLQQRELEKRGYEPGLLKSASFREIYRTAIELGWINKFVKIRMFEDDWKRYLVRGFPITSILYNSHAVLITGYNEAGYTVCDPKTAKTLKQPRFYMKEFKAFSEAYICYL